MTVYVAFDFDNSLTDVKSGEYSSFTDLSVPGLLWASPCPRI
jgi:hypothetical protein